jgi:hypothetical protein
MTSTCNNEYSDEWVLEPSSSDADSFVKVATTDDDDNDCWIDCIELLVRGTTESKSKSRKSAQQPATRNCEKLLTHQQQREDSSSPCCGMVDILVVLDGQSFSSKNASSDLGRKLLLLLLATLKEDDRFGILSSDNNTNESIVLSQKIYLEHCDLRGKLSSMSRLHRFLERTTTTTHDKNNKVMSRTSIIEHYHEIADAFLNHDNDIPSTGSSRKLLLFLVGDDDESSNLKDSICKDESSSTVASLTQQRFPDNDGWVDVGGEEEMSSPIHVIGCGGRPWQDDDRQRVVVTKDFPGCGSCCWQWIETEKEVTRAVERIMSHRRPLLLPSKVEQLEIYQRILAAKKWPRRSQRVPSRVLQRGMDSSATMNPRDISAAPCSASDSELLNECSDDDRSSSWYDSSDCSSEEDVSVSTYHDFDNDKPRFSSLHKPEEFLQESEKTCSLYESDSSERSSSQQQEAGESSRSSVSSLSLDSTREAVVSRGPSSIVDSLLLYGSDQDSDDDDLTF